MGERTATFLSGLSWSMAAAIFSRLVTGLTTLYLARTMGPSEFGEANLSLAASLWVQIPLFFGLPTALVFFLSRSPKEEKNAWINNGLLLMLVCLAFTLLISLLFRGTFAHVLGLSPIFFFWAVIYSACMWPFNLLRTFLNAEEEFKKRSWVEVAYAVSFPLIAFVFLSRGYRSGAYLLGLMLPYALIGLVGLLKHGFSLSSFRFSENMTQQLLTFGALASLGSLAAAMFETPARIAIHSALGAEEVGILSAYQGASTQIAGFFAATVTQVFFPIAARTPNKWVLFGKIRKLSLWGFPLLTPAFMGVIWLFISILGSKYPFQLSLCFLFAIAAFTFLVHSVIAWMILSYGTAGVLLNGLVGIAGGLINIFGCSWAAPRYQIYGTCVVYIAANLFSIAIFSMPSIHRWLSAKEQKVFAP